MSTEDINKIIKKQQTLKKNKETANSEYKIINSSENYDEEASKETKITVPEIKEIDEISKEVNENTCMEEDNEDGILNENFDSSNIDDLKKEILENPEEV